MTPVSLPTPATAPTERFDPAAPSGPCPAVTPITTTPEGEPLPSVLQVANSEGVSPRPDSPNSPVTSKSSVFPEQYSYRYRLGQSFELHDLKPMPADDDNLLVVCSGDYTGAGWLTRNGAKLLQAANPELFPTEDHAIDAFETLEFNNAPFFIDSEEYQTIARLIKQHVEAGSLDEILLCPAIRGTVPSPVYITQVPFGMIRHKYLNFEGEYGKYEIQRGCTQRYKRFLKELTFTSNLHSTLQRDDWSAQKKIDSLLLLFPPDKEQVTLEELMRNADCLLGEIFKQARQSFLEQSDKQNAQGGTT